MQQHFENQQGALLTWESWGDRTSPSMGFQDGSVVKNTSANAGGERNMSSIPESGMFPGGGYVHPLQYFCLGNSVHRRV